jgi:hypothetical protein
MGSACRIHGEKVIACRVLVGNLEKREQQEDPDVGGRILLK